MDNSSPSNARTVVVGGGTMGADVAVVLARGGAQVTVVDPPAARRDHLLPHIAQELAAAGQATHAGPVQVCASLQDVDWSGVVLVVECITEQLAAKQKLFAELETVAPPNAVLASNSSGFPISAIAQGLATAQRMLGLHFFMPAHLVPLVEVVLGERSNPALGTLLYVNLIWIWGHPEVYILILPCFGIFSEVVATFCKKRLFGYTSMVYATVVITIMSYLVWLHHFFTMGSGASVNTFFGITTMIISIPTGAKIFNWLFTMYKGRIRFELPMMWTVAFMVTFTIGGMTGVLLAVPPADFVLHNSLFLIAHFHNVIIGGVLFGLFAAITYWFPKAFGYKLDPFWGKCSFWFWLTGFWFAFTPLYVLGLMGVTRRMSHFEDPSLQIWFVIAAIGAVIILCGIVAFLVQIVVSIRNREALRDVTGDPW